ncbi:MAG: hypothetical protein ACREIR_25585, partial [Geminicoccaceae bacterium]
MTLALASGGSFWRMSASFESFVPIRTPMIVRVCSQEARRIAARRSFRAGSASSNARSTTSEGNSRNANGSAEASDGDR